MNRQPPKLHLPAVPSLAALLLFATLAGLTTGLLGLLSPLAGGLEPRLAYVVAFLAVTTATVAGASLAPSLSWGHLAVVLFASILSLGALSYWGDALAPSLAAVAITVTLLTGGSLVGAAVGGRIDHAGHLLVVVIVSVLVDTFSVFHEAGPTAAVVSRPALMAVLALPWPVLGTTTFSPVLGVGDVVFAGLYLAASRRFALNLWRTRIAVAAGLVATMVAVIIVVRPLPALVGMGVAMVVAHPEARKLAPEDRRPALLAVGLLVLLWLALWLWR
jgi:hypothetical protein